MLDLCSSGAGLLGNELLAFMCSVGGYSSRKGHYGSWEECTRRRNDCYDKKIRGEERLVAYDRYDSKEGAMLAVLQKESGEIVAYRLVTLWGRDDSAAAKY